MKDSIIKIICLSIIISLNWVGVSAIGNTFAIFSDTEISNGNIYQAGTLDFSILKSSDFSPEINSDQNSNKRIELQNEGSINFKYIIKATNISGDLCEEVKIQEEGGEYEKMEEFKTSTTTFSNKKDWNFKAKAFSNIEEDMQGEICEFDFEIEGWQVNFNNNSKGFTNKEIISNKIEGGFQESPIVLNEFLPNPSDEGKHQEFIELYNNSNNPISVKDYQIKIGRTVPINPQKTSAYSNGTTTIPAKGWLVVAPLDDSNNANSAIDDEGGTIILLDDNKNEIASYTYGIPASSTEITPGDSNSTSSGEVPVNKSYARIPDGTGDWVDPIPTPGSANDSSKENDSPTIKESTTTTNTTSTLDKDKTITNNKKNATSKHSTSTSSSTEESTSSGENNQDIKNTISTKTTSTDPIINSTTTIEDDESGSSTEEASSSKKIEDTEENTGSSTEKQIVKEEKEEKEEKETDLEDKENPVKLEDNSDTNKENNEEGDSSTSTDDTDSDNETEDSTNETNSKN